MSVISRAACKLQPRSSMSIHTEEPFSPNGLVIAAYAAVNCVSRVLRYSKCVLRTDHAVTAETGGCKVIVVASSSRSETFRVRQVY